MPKIAIPHLTTLSRSDDASFPSQSMWQWVACLWTTTKEFDPRYDVWWGIWKLPCSRIPNSRCTSGRVSDCSISKSNSTDKPALTFQGLSRSLSLPSRSNRRAFLRCFVIRAKNTPFLGLSPVLPPSCGSVDEPALPPKLCIVLAAALNGTVSSDYFVLLFIAGGCPECPSRKCFGRWYRTRSPRSLFLECNRSTPSPVKCSAWQQTSHPVTTLECVTYESTFARTSKWQGSVVGYSGFRNTHRVLAEAKMSCSRLSLVKAGTSSSTFP